MNKITELTIIKNILLKNPDLVIKTINKELNITGVGSFCANNRIKVFEGNSDGSDNKIYSYEEFICNYKYDVVKECEV